MSELFAEVGGIEINFRRDETRLLSPTTTIVYGAYMVTSARPGHEIFTLVKEGNEWLIAADQISGRWALLTLP